VDLCNLPFEVPRHQRLARVVLIHAVLRFLSKRLRLVWYPQSQNCRAQSATHGIAAALTRRSGTSSGARRFPGPCGILCAGSTFAWAFLAAIGLVAFTRVIRTQSAVTLPMSLDSANLGSREVRGKHGASPERCCCVTSNRPNFQMFSQIRSDV